MSTETIRILPNPEWLESMYQELTDEGKIELDRFLSAQDLEVNADGEIIHSPIRYGLIPSEVKATVLFADGHTEVWDASVSNAGEIVFKDNQHRYYEHLMSIRPDGNEIDSETIIDIELHLTHQLIGF